MSKRANFFSIAIIFLLMPGLLSSPAQAQTPPPPDPQLPGAEVTPAPPSEAPSEEGTGDLRGPGGAGAPDEDWQIYSHTTTGKARFLTTRSGNPIQQPGFLPAGSTPEAAARNFLGVYGDLFGLSDSTVELKLIKESNLEQEEGDSTSMRHFVRFQQLYQGTPVLGGELIVQMDADLNVLSVNGEALPGLALETTPFIDAESASQKALQVVADEYIEEYGVAPDDLQATEPELWIYNPLLLGAPGLREDSLVWRMEVTARELLPIRELVLVDAGRGLVKLHFNQIDAAKDRAIYDNQNNPSYGLPGNGPVREEGDLGTGVADVDNAYDYSGFTYDFYSSRHGRDSIDGKGMKLASTVRYCPSGGPCPYANAFWNGTQMVYGEGYASADDVVAHELTHGVTRHESGLLYYMQSGAINEAFSDIWGEFTDLSYTNGNDDDSAGVRWELGEDIGAIRDMSNPPAFGDPDRMGSGNYYCGSLDNGGVHTNSGVANKAAYLMVDGGSFNGYTIGGIGLEKTAKIWYLAQTSLITSAADYQDLGLALGQACTILIGTAGITNSDCLNVREAAAAVEMHAQPACPAPHAPLCDSYGFDSQFNGTAPGWYSYTGIWYMGATYLYTSGVDNAFASAANTGTFTDFDYEVRMQRLGGNDNNGVIVRGEPYPFGSGNRWNEGYAFYYTRDGFFSVFRYDSGSAVTLQGWTISEAINTGDAWNNLRVVAEGHNLYFYINGDLVWLGRDSTYSSGQAGLLMYSASGGSDELQVDWAVLNGGSPQPLFYDNLENPVSGNWYSYAPSGSNYWFYPQSNNPFGDHSFYNNPQYATSGNYNFWGFDAAEVGDYYVRMTKNIALPASEPAYLHFNHAYDFYSNRSGGVVEYTTNDGASYNDASGMFTHNGYNGSIANGYSNPLQGRNAFVNDSDGMISSRLDLTSLAGQNVRFRFHIGSAAYEDIGWLIDDVRIYTCEPRSESTYLPLVMNGAPGAVSFHSPFSGYASNWQAHSGIWTATPLYYSTTGLSGTSASASYPQNFDTFFYTVRLKRIGCQSCSNRIIIRGTPTPLTLTNHWDDAIEFQYNANGSFYIWKWHNGSDTTLQGWTASPAIKTGDAWNVLSVLAWGSDLYFYINGALVWIGSDSDLASGRGGVGMYTSGGEWDRLDVDWVSLETGSLISRPEGSISPEQQSLNEAAAPGGSGDVAP
jgi:Zn-dependent metalloprotease